MLVGGSGRESGQGNVIDLLNLACKVERTALLFCEFTHSCVNDESIAALVR